MKGWARGIVSILVAALAACAGDGGGVEVVDARLVAPAGDAPAALYLTIAHRGRAADTLVAVTLDEAERTELHQTMEHQGMTHMMPVAGVALAPGETVSMRPGGMHVMVFGLREGVVPGDTVGGTVRLVREGVVPIRAVVISYAELVADPADGGEAR